MYIFFIYWLIHIRLTGHSCVLGKNLKRVAEKKGKTMTEEMHEALSEYLVKEQESIFDKLTDTSGVWKDRDEIVDSDGFVNEMRNKWSGKEIL